VEAAATVDSSTRRSPLTPFVCCAAITVALIVAGAVVFAERYREMVEIETRAGRITYLDGVIVRLNDTQMMSAKMAAATGDPAWEVRYHDAEHPLDAAVKEALELAPSSGRAAAQQAVDADTALDAIEERALALSRDGKLAQAQALFDAGYDAQRTAYTDAMDASMQALSAATHMRIRAHHRTMSVAMAVGATALVCLILFWVHMLRLIRRYIQDRNAADAELRGAHTTLETRVEQRTRELAASREQFRSLIENIEAIPFEWDPVTNRIRYIAPQAARLLDCPVDALHDEGLLDKVMHDGDRARFRERIDRFVAGEYPCTVDFRMFTWTKRIVTVRMFLGGRVSQTCPGVMLDITRQAQLEAELQQSQKLESVGRLAAGIAHEINTPVQFVSDSVQFLRSAFADAVPAIARLHESSRAALGCPSCSGLAQIALDAEAEADMGYLSEHLPEALDLAADGLSRVATIVHSMKVFAHPDRKDQAQIDVNEAITSTLTIARNEYKYVAELETHLGALPPVTCYAGELNQVILNLVVNAAHAIGDAVAGSERRGKITVTTRRDDQHVAISIADTGTGIPAEIRDRVFDPFFTTKEVGKGTGQGLSHARAVIVDKHGGSLTFDTELGGGTTFHIRLPIDGSPGRELSSPRAAAPAAVTA
jgi:signal transduction histidine kinase